MDEAERLASLRDLDLLDSPPEKEFQDLVRLAAAVCGTPISLISLVDESRQWFKARVGMLAQETTRDVSFCSHAIRNDALFIVEDATEDERFRDNDLVTSDPSIRFYAGLPLQAPGGGAIGTLCVLDTVPRILTEEQKDALNILGAQVQARIDARARQRYTERCLEENVRLCGELKASTDLFLAFMNHGPFASYIKDADGAMLFYNKFLAERFGVGQEEWLGRKDHELWPVEIADAFRANDLAVLAGGLPVEIAETSPAPGGGISFWKSLKFPYQGGDGRLLLAGMSIDVSHDVLREAALERALKEKSLLTRELEGSRHILQSFMDHNPNNIYVKDDAGRYVFYNDQFARFFGISKTAWIGRTDHEVRPKGVADLFRAHDLQVLSSQKVVDTVAHVEDFLGRLHSFKSIKFSYRDVEGRTLVGGVGVDVTEQLKREESLADANCLLEFLATTDSLTGLSNRRVFGERAEVEFAVARRKERPLSMLVLDIDDFKQRNDLLGHSGGDEALRLIGAVLARSTRLGDLSARLGGEEFGFLLPDTDAAGAATVAERVQRLLRQAPSSALPLTVSIGVATLLPETGTWEDLLRLADEAMYLAKQSGKNRIISHEPASGRSAIPARAFRDLPSLCA